MRFGSRKREKLYDRDAAAAQAAGLGRFPICPHCKLPVKPGQAWDVCHIDIPRVFGGTETAVGHRACNQLDNNRNVTPAVSKADSVRKKHVGITGPGLGRYPMKAGRRSPITRTIAGGVRPRLTLAQKLAAMNAKRFFLDVTAES